MCNMQYAMYKWQVQVASVHEGVGVGSAYIISFGSLKEETSVERKLYAGRRRPAMCECKPEWKPESASPSASRTTTNVRGRLPVLMPITCGLPVGDNGDPAA